MTRFREGSCVVCGDGTDTTLAVSGESEWHVAALMNLGVPTFLAEGTLRAATGSDPGMVPDGRFNVFVTVCRRCVSVSKFAGQITPVLALYDASIPTISQPSG